MPEKTVSSPRFISSAEPLRVRLAALEILEAVAQSGQTLDAVLDHFRQQHSFDLQADRALLQSLVFGVLRWRKRIDFIIGSFSRTPLKKVQPQILNILRIGTFQLVFLDRIPASAAVHTSVEMAKSLAPVWVVRFVNAVLRKVAARHGDLRYPSIDHEPVAALAVQKSFPAWLIRRWFDRFGLEETARFCDAVNTIPPITLRANSLKIDRDSLLQELSKQGESAQASPHTPDGILLNRLTRPFAEMETYRSGYFQVQDEAAQLVSLLLNPRPGERILDACAGLGGKTGHIAQLMRNTGSLVALDISEKKLAVLTAEMIRLGITNVTTDKRDLADLSTRDDIGTYDRILLDAPCSGLGVLRRNPDAKWTMNKHSIDRCSKRQKVLLDNVAVLVDPGGLLVYSVCSTEPEECEAVVDHFLAGHDNFRIDEPTLFNPSETTRIVDPDGRLKTYPHRHHMDGFFAARFRRI